MKASTTDTRARVPTAIAAALVALALMPAAAGAQIPSADLSLEKTDSADPIAVGANLTYTLSVENASLFSAASVVITDTLPGSVQFVGGTVVGGSACQHSNGTVSCSVGLVPGFGSATARIVVRPQQSGSITNSASVSSATPDPSPGDNSAAEATTVFGADLSLAAIADTPDPVKENSPLGYAIEVLATGPGSSSGVQLAAELPPGADFLDADVTAGGTPPIDPCSRAASSLTCEVGTLAPGETATAGVLVVPRQPGPIALSAEVSADEVDPSPGNDSAGEPTTVLAALPDLAITKTDSPDPVATGAPLTYTLEVRNVADASNGIDNATAVEIVDELPPGVSFASAGPGCANDRGTVTCSIATLAEGASASRTIRVMPRSAGTLVNTAAVAADEPDPVGGNDSDSAQTLVEAVAGPAGPPRCGGFEATIVGTRGDDVIRGTPGDDVIVARGGADDVRGRSGDDVICLGGGFDLGRGGAGTDVIFGDSGADFILAGKGADRIRGKGGPDRIKAGAGDDRAAGGGGADEIRGQGGDDSLRGEQGPDRIHGGPGRNRCRGGPGRDHVRC